MDSLAGPLLARLFPALPAPVLPLSDVQRVLFIRPGGIGDAVLLVPAIQAVQQAWPAAQIEVLAERRNAAVFDLCPAVRRIFCYDVPRHWRDFLLNRYDLIIDTEQWHYLSAVMARLLRGRVRCGFDTNERARLFSCPVPYWQDCYEVESFYRLLDGLKIARPGAAATPFLTVLDAALSVADDVLGALVDRPVVALFPGASIAERRWSAEFFRVLAQRCYDSGWAVVVVGGPQDKDLAERICRDRLTLNLAGRLTLPQTAAVLRRCTLLVSGDSGVLHLGVGLGIRTVSLFGPGIAEKWAPEGAKHRVVNLKLPCSPCTRFGTTPPCPVGGRCIKEISADQVWVAVSVLMKG
ncbi:MAG: glycosyltransferase family 9 protein [Desulfuromonadaceae bacterium]|nr:glycosyltransferase family 9 protein [Desulfuromonadaceae bacterium]